jgi:organic radical activating enzyme
MLNFLSLVAQGNKKRVFLEIKGGEPTYWKELPYFLEVCSAKRWGACVVTNGSQTLAWWEKNLANMADVNFSLHPESYDLANIFPKIRFINERRYLFVKVLMYPPYFDKCIADIRTLQKEIPGLNIRAIYVAQPGTGNKLYEYSEDQKRQVQEVNAYQRQKVKRIWPPFPFEDRYRAVQQFTDGSRRAVEAQNLKINSENQWASWLCRAGLDRIHVDVGGNIYRGQCKQGGLLGNIHVGEWTVPSEEVVCQKARCFCGSELLLEKWNPKRICLTRPGGVHV